MQNWQKDRNYYKRKNLNGSYTFIITIESNDVEVTEEVYLAYSQADRRERYLEERDAEILLSLDRMEEDSVPPFLTNLYTPSAEDDAIYELLLGQTMAILESLPESDRALIQTVIMDGVTEQAYADDIGVRQSTVNKRKRKILKNIFEIMELNP